MTMKTHAELLLICYIIYWIIKKCVRGERQVESRVSSYDTLKSVKLELCEDKKSNHAFVVSATFAGKDCLFLLDTAYAGAPVLSTSYLTIRDKKISGSVSEQYKHISELLSKQTNVNDRHRAVKNLINSKSCRSYTSGCVMRLMGIGETAEMQADMLLCPLLKIKGDEVNKNDLNADIFVTHPLPGSIHILTCDYLLHRSPCLICPRRNAIYFHPQSVEILKKEQGFEFQDAFLVGGAFTIKANVGGAHARLVVDSGAAATLSLGKTLSKQLKICKYTDGGPRRISQSGVHGESICSEVYHTSISFGKIHFDDVCVYANEYDVEGADGYIGIGMIHALDVWLEHNKIGIRANGNPPLVPPLGKKGLCGTSSLPCVKF